MRQAGPPEASTPATPTLGVDALPAPGAILPTDRLDVAGRKAMATHVDRLLQAEAKVREPGEADELRRYRVATRRLREALRLFQAAYRPSATRPLLDGLAAVAAPLGRVRDLDVRLRDAEAWAQARGDGTPTLLLPLLERWREERVRAALDLERHLGSRRHARFIGRLTAFVQPATAGHDSRAAASHVRDRAASHVWRAFERIRALGADLGSADDPTLHRLRIDAKRLRYSLELLGDVLGPDCTWLVAQLVAVQDELGAMNDLSLTSGAVGAFLGARGVRRDPDELAAIAAYRDACDERVARGRKALGPRHRRVVGLTFMRRLARTVVIP